MFGYGRNRQKRYIGPTVLDLGKAAALGEKEGEMPASMQEELFGPILPVLTYCTLKEAAAFIGRREHPLALYIFTKIKRQKNGYCVTPSQEAWRSTIPSVIWWA